MTATPSILTVIPARMQSSRFPGKPLAKLLDRSMLEHVYLRAMMSKVAYQTVIATCDSEIQKASFEFGAQAVMTSKSHERCTERVAEVARNLFADIYVLVQGDEPLFHPDMLKILVRPLLDDPSIPCSNLMTAISPSSDEWKSPNVVKVVYSLDYSALYMSREAIPTGRKGKIGAIAKQLGIIAFRRECLFRYVSLTATPLEEVESVDMLRLLEHRIPIRMVYSSHDSLGVDTPEDLEKAEQKMAVDPIYKLYSNSKQSASPRGG